MVTTFHKIAWAEAASLLILLGIAMPLKYIYGMPQAVRAVGWIHGLLFLLYMGSLAYVASEKNWPLTRTFRAVVAGLIPFGPLLLQRDEH
jgi:integral membrane protein